MFMIYTHDKILIDFQLESKAPKQHQNQLIQLIQYPLRIRIRRTIQSENTILTTFLNDKEPSKSNKVMYSTILNYFLINYTIFEFIYLHIYFKL